MVKIQEDIQGLFRKALTQIIEKAPRGTKARIARKAGVSNAYVTDLLKGRRPGSEDGRRALASALGIPYEKMLNLGRQIEGKKSKIEGIDIAKNITGEREGFADPLEGGKMRIKRLLQDAETVLQSNSVYARVLAMNIDAFMLCYNDMKRKKERKRSRPQMIGQGAYP